MYKVTRRSNLIPFLLILLVGIAASIYVPQVFADTKGEIPAFALFPGEIAIALIFSVLLFENATPAELIKIAGFMLFIAFLDGALCNLVGGHTVWMPDATLQLNWAQLAAFNLTGIGGIMALYTTVPADSAYSSTSRQTAARETPPKEAAAPKIDFSPAEAAATAQDSKEIISQLDQGRIEQLEQSISTNPQAPEKVSLESLFAEENQAAASSKKSEPAPAPVAEPAPTPEPVAPPPAPEPVKEPEPEPFKLDLGLDEPTPAPEPVKAAEPEAAPAAPTGGLLQDVSGDIEDIFGSLVGEEAQKDFAPSAKTEEPAAPPEPEPAAPEAPPAAPVAEEPAASFGPKMTDAGSSAKAAVKEFGKLSASAAGKPEAAGTLKTIGQMLLDTAAVEKIIKTAGDKPEGGTKWRVLTVDRGADLQALMDLMTEYEGVESALLMGKDGLLLSNTESLSALKYVFGPLSLAMQSTTNLGTSKLQMGELRQAVLRTGDKISVLTDVGSAILAVFGEWNLDKLDGLMAHINKGVAGSSAVGGDLPAEEAAPDLSAPPPAAAPEPAPAPEPAGGGIVNVSDNEMTDLFDNLLDENSSDKKKEEPAPAAPAPAAAPAGGIVNVSDNEMTDLFDNLLDENSSDKKKEEVPQAPAAAAPAAGGLMNVSDKEVGDIFDNLLGGDAAAPEKGMDFSPADKAAAAAKAETPPAAKPDAKQEKGKKKPDSKPPGQIKEFGKLSVQASKQDTGTEAGAMKAIGRQLIDVQAVENIIKAGEKREKIGSGLTTARVISAARGEGIKTLLSKIDTYEGVIGSLIVGHDGLVIASTLQGGIDKDMMGAMSTAIHSHLDVAVKKLEKGKLQQTVFFGQGERLTVMTAVAVGILAVFVDNAGVAQVDGLLNAIETTVKG